MHRRNFTYAALAALGAGLFVPVHAEITGAAAGYSGAPGDGTCLSCHGSRANSNGGSVTISLASGTTYTPGQATQVTVTVSDPTAKDWGFEASPRATSNPSRTGAGSMAPLSDGYTQVLKSSTLQWITHTLAGTRRGTTGSATFQFNWTPPATNVGNVEFYVAANAGNNNDQADSGDHIYTASLTLTAQAATSSTAPAIQQNGVVNAFSNSTSHFAPGMWVTIYGSNLSATTRTWATSDFSGGTGPQTLDGVSATVNGKAAVLNYVSPAQVNVQIPTDAGTGASALLLTAPGGTSSSYPLTVTQYAPTLNQNASFAANGKNYVVAQFADGTYVGPAGLIPGVSFRPAQAGDTIVIFGIGFGALQTPLSTGQIASGLDATASPVTFTIGSATVTPSYAGASPGFVAAYQFNLVIPSNAGSGDVPIDAMIGGASTGQGLYLTLQ